jgi:uncharacterized protein
MTRCPICGKPVKDDDPNLPFCSDRCRIIDLGNWASEKYVVPGEPLPEEPLLKEPSSKEDE